MDFIERWKNRFKAKNALKSFASAGTSLQTRRTDVGLVIHGGEAPRRYEQLATSTYKALHTGRPPYLTDLLQYHKSSVSTRSSTSQLLAIPRHDLSFGSRSFRVSAPRIWNSLTPQIRQCQTLATFRCHLKTHYFQSTFSAT